MSIETIRAAVNDAKRLPPSAEPDEQLDGLQFEFADQLGDVDETPDDLVQGVITNRAMSVIYGDSNCGKTFAEIDLAAAVARGIDWMGRHVDHGLVIYLAAESPSSVRTRLRAYQQHHGVKVPHFAIVRSPINLYDSEADVEAVIRLVRDLERRTGQRCVLIVGDTLARLSAGANENSGEDMGVVVRQVDYIRAQTGAHFALVHHCGKDAAKGARGWSGLRAATDTEIEVTVDEATQLRCLEITKQRDLPTKGDRIGFKLMSVPIGIDKWGGLRTSCVVVPTDAPTRAEKGKRPSEIAGAISVLLGQHGTGMKKPALYDVLSTKPFKWNRNSVKNEVSRMVRDGRLHESVGIVALSAAPEASS